MRKLIGWLLIGIPISTLLFLGFYYDAKATLFTLGLVGFATLLAAIMTIGVMLILDDEGKDSL